MMLTYWQVIELHNRLVELKLCMGGLRDNNLLISAINGQNWYNDILSQYIHVAYSINAGHVFSDGNKRTTYLVLKELNKFRYFFNDDKLSDEILNLAKGNMSKEEFYKRVIRTLL